MTAVGKNLNIFSLQHCKSTLTALVSRFAVSTLVHLNTLVCLNIALGIDFEVDHAIDPYGSMTVLALNRTQQ